MAQLLEPRILGSLVINLLPNDLVFDTKGFVHLLAQLSCTYDPTSDRRRESVAAS